MRTVLRSLIAILAGGVIPTAARAQSGSDIDARQQQIQIEAAQLNADCSQVLQEMRSGMWCSECRRSSSEIEKSGEGFQTHLSRVKGKPVPATQQQLDAKNNECRLKHQQLQREFDRLNAQRQQIRRAQEQARLDEDRRRRETEQRSYQQQERQRAEQYLQQQRAREQRGAQGAQLIQDVIDRNLQNQATIDEMLNKMQGILEGGRGSGESVLRPIETDYSDDSDADQDWDDGEDALSRYVQERDAALKAYQERANLPQPTWGGANSGLPQPELGGSQYTPPAPTPPSPPAATDYFSAQLTADLSAPRVPVNAGAGNQGPESFFSNQLYADINGNGGSSSSGPDDREQVGARRVSSTSTSVTTSASQQDYFRQQLLQEAESPGTTVTDGNRDLSTSARTTAQQFVQGASEKLANAWLKGGDGSIETAIKNQTKSTFERFLENRLTDEATEVNALTKFGKAYDELDPVDKADAALSARALDVFRNFLRDRDNVFRLGRGTEETADKLTKPGFDDVFGESDNPSR